jgi:ABC-type multidrug transport system permease subunit
MRDSGVTKYRFAAPSTLLFSPRMQGTTSTHFNAAGAGGVLLAVLAACVGIGALVGWAAGSGAIGALFGAVVGIFGGIVAVYLRYGNMS